MNKRAQTREIIKIILWIVFIGIALLALTFLFKRFI